MNITSFVVKSKLWVALAAALFAAEWMTMMRTDFIFGKSATVFFLTLSAYLFLDNHDWKWRKTLIYLSVTGSVLSFLLFPILNMTVVLFSALLVVTYQTEWLREVGVRGFFEWRKIPVLKNVVIALCWVMLTNLAVVNEASWTENAFVFIGNFLFIVALSIAEDIVDSGKDGINTIPRMLGSFGVRLVAISLLLLSVLFYLKSTMGYKELAGAVLISSLSIVVVWFIRPTAQRHLQSFLIDGLIVLRSFFALVYFL